MLHVKTLKHLELPDVQLSSFGLGVSVCSLLEVVEVELLLALVFRPKIFRIVR